jgi:hypothetical protein
LLFQSVDTPQRNGELVCSQNRASDTSACGPVRERTLVCFEGIRIFDLTDPAHPVYLKAVYTDCGSHTHTLVPDLSNNRLLIYVSSYPGRVQMSSFMIPRPQGSTYCSVHNGNIIPIAGRYILVAAWYGGGTSVIDFTNPSQPSEIGYYVATTDRRADTWSSYWYNGKIYANDISRGQDVFQLDISGDTQTWDHLNQQTQEDLSPRLPSSFSPLARLAAGALNR